MRIVAGCIFSRSYLKKVFWPNPGVGPGFQILDILQYASCLKPGPACTLDLNPFFEIASNEVLDGEWDRTQLQIGTAFSRSDPY